MVDTVAPGAFSFLGNEPTGYEAMEMRRRIALQMLMGGKKKGYPKTLGEGLASIGDALGDIGLMRAMQQQAALQQQQTNTAIKEMQPQAVPSSGSGGGGGGGGPKTESSPRIVMPPHHASLSPGVLDPSHFTPGEPIKVADVPPVPETDAGVSAAPIGPDTSGFNAPMGDAPVTTASVAPDTAEAPVPQSFLSPEPTGGLSGGTSNEGNVVALPQRVATTQEQPIQPHAATPPPPSPEHDLVTSAEQPPSILNPAQTSGLEGGIDPAGKYGEPRTVQTTPIQPPASATKVSDASQDGDVPPIDGRLMKAVMAIESGGKPNARTGSYKGLYQLSDSEFARYGGQGSIYDPAENTRVAALKLADEGRDLSRALGRSVTPEEVYLAHQQGVGGATAHLTNPDQPAYLSMASTGEGRQKGEGWARQAIWRNVPDDLKGQFGKVENVTSQQFADLWKEKYDHFAGGGGGNTATASASPRESVTARMMANNVQPPQADNQDAVLSDALALGSLNNETAYPQTASLGGSGGEVQSDAPETGMLGAKTGNAIAATAQARRDAITKRLTQQPPELPVDSPPAQQAGPPLAANDLLSPRTMTDAPSTFGGPQAAAQQPPQDITPAPQTDAIRPIIDHDPKSGRPIPPTPPPPLGMGPEEQRLTPYLYADVDPRVKKAAEVAIMRERAELAAQHKPLEERFSIANETYKEEVKSWLEANQPRYREQTRETGYKADQERLNLRELPNKLLDEAVKRRADAAKAVDEATRSGIDTKGYGTKVKAEADELAAKASEQQAKAASAQENQTFLHRTGRDREPFIKDFKSDKDRAETAARTTEDLKRVRSALDTGAVISGFGATAKFNLARLGAALGSNDAAYIAHQSEIAKISMDRTISAAVKLVQGGDTRVTDSDVMEARGLQGKPEDQEASRRKILNVMQEDQNKVLKKYEDDRETYLRGDPQHKYFKVDAPQVGDPGAREALLKHRDNEYARQKYDLKYGNGSADLEISRAKRREERAAKAAKAAEEDD